MFYEQQSIGVFALKRHEYRMFKDIYFTLVYHKMLLFIIVQIVFYVAGKVYLKGNNLAFGIFKSQNIDKIDIWHL